MASRLVEDAFDRQVKTWRWSTTHGHRIVYELLTPRVGRSYDNRFMANSDDWWSSGQAHRHAQEILVMERVSGYARTFALAEDIGNATWAASQSVPNDTVLEREHVFEPMGFVWSEAHLRIPAYVSGTPVTSDGSRAFQVEGDEPFTIPAQGFTWYVVDGKDDALGMPVKTENDKPLTGVYFLFIGAGEEFAEIAGVPRDKASTAGVAQMQYSLFWRFGDSLEDMRRRADKQQERLNLGEDYDTDDNALTRAKFAWAFWRFIQTDIMRRSKFPVNRQRQRSANRLKWPGEPVVDVVELRRRRYEPNGMSDEQHREWSCRWLVSGHWRRQWYASLGIHKTIWVDGYIKGPDSKPLVVKGPRVYAVVR